MYNVSNNSIKEIRDWKLFTSNIKSIVFVTIILCIGYLPYILHYYPGNVLIDSVVQILQGQGAIPLTNHHPVLHTEIIAICMNIGHSLFGSYSSGAAIYTIGQTIITSFVFSFTIYYMARKNISVYIRVITLLFFMFCPTICFYTITMYKDIPFALSVLLATIGINEMVNNTSNFFKSKIRCIYLMLMITLIMFFRNNGVYAIVLSFPFIIILPDVGSSSFNINLINVDFPTPEFPENAVILFLKNSFCKKYFNLSIPYFVPLPFLQATLSLINLFSIFGIKTLSQKHLNTILSL